MDVWVTRQKKKCKTTYFELTINIFTLCEKNHKLAKSASFLFPT